MNEPQLFRNYSLDYHALRKFLVAHMDRFHEEATALVIHRCCRSVARRLNRALRWKLEIVVRRSGCRDDWALLSYNGLTWIEAP